MAPLSTPHWEVIPLETRAVMEAVGQMPFSHRFYLAGGTALALRLGHRVSRDLDFFSEEDELAANTRAEIWRHIQSLPEAVRITDAPGDLTANVLGRHLGFYSYGYRLLDPTDEVLNVRVAGLRDVGLMKLDAIAGRGARRDFYDVYVLSRHIPLDQLLERGADKYPLTRDFAMTVISYLVDFTNADKDIPVDSFPQVSWEQVRDHFLAEARRIASSWLGTSAEGAQ